MGQRPLKGQICREVHNPKRFYIRISSHFNFRAKSCAGQDGVKNKQMEKPGKNENFGGQKQKAFFFESLCLCPKLICSVLGSKMTPAAVFTSSTTETNACKK